MPDEPAPPPTGDPSAPDPPDQPLRVEVRSAVFQVRAAGDMSQQDTPRLCVLLRDPDGGGRTCPRRALPGGDVGPRETLAQSARRHLADDLDVSVSTIQWVSTVYLLALAVTILDPAPSVARNTREAARSQARKETKRHTPDELHGMVADLITLLEGKVQPDLRKGRYPDRKTAQRISEVVRAVARELEA